MIRYFKSVLEPLLSFAAGELSDSDWTELKEWIRREIDQYK